MTKFNELNTTNCEINPFELIGKGLLIAVKSGDKINAMTASWGCLGVLWHKNVAICYIRPQRYTFELLRGSDYYTLCALSEQHKEILAYCGRYSGRNTDKIKETGLIPIIHDDWVSFEQADFAIKCKKIHCQFIHPEGFMSGELDKNNYPNKDYHLQIVGEVI